MDRAPVEFLSGTKACRDCAHYEKDERLQLERCSRSRQVNYISGKVESTLCFQERLLETACGTKAIHFLPSRSFEAARSVRRQQLQQAIEDGISRLNPDATEAQEIFDALTASLSARYAEDAPGDMQDSAKEFRLSLDALDDVTAEPFMGSDLS